MLASLRYAKRSLPSPTPTASDEYRLVGHPASRSPLLLHLTAPDLLSALVLHRHLAAMSCEVAGPGPLSGGDKVFYALTLAEVNEPTIPSLQRLMSLAFFVAQFFDFLHVFAGRFEGSLRLVDAFLEGVGCKEAKVCVGGRCAR